MVKKILLKIKLYLIYPHKLKRDIRKALFMPFYKKKGLITLEPNYLFFPSFKKNEIAIDVGCGYQAELSRFLIDNFDMNCFCVDPTQKHQPFLKQIAQLYPGKLTHLQYALCTQNGSIDFNETLDNESGSLYNDHKNIINDRTIKYTVEGIDIPSLLKKTGKNEIAFLKIDIEGAEYELLSNTMRNDLLQVKQIFVEFHHISIKQFTKQDTKRIVQRISSFGFRAYSLDGLNYLFIRN